jgi:hypothetical protein
MVSLKLTQIFQHLPQYIRPAGDWINTGLFLLQAGQIVFSKKAMLPGRVLIHSKKSEYLYITWGLCFMGAGL